MTDREKLIELLDQCDRCNAEYCNQCEFGKDIDGCVLMRKEIIADTLLANGVTFATDTNDGGKWIGVEDRLPECKQDVLMYFDTGNMAVGWWYDRDEVITFWSAYSDDGWYTDCDCEPLYWMPLPEPPKEE